MTKSKLKYAFYGKVTDGISKTLTTCFKWGFAFLMIRELAGKLTIADIKVLIGVDEDNAVKLDALSSLALKSGITVGILGLLAGISGIVYGYRQKKLKEQAISRTGSRIKSLEAKIDPKRTSSHLTNSGTTRKEDI